MSTSEATVSTSYLDEELRKRTALINELREVIDKQEVTIADQAQRIASLESRLTKMQGQWNQVAELEQALQNTRDELVLQISDIRQEFQKREAEFLRNRQAERERDARAINELASELERIAPLEQAAVARQAEDHRLNEMILRLQEELQEATKHFSQQDDVGRRLAERIEKLGVQIGQTEDALQEVKGAQQTQSTRLLSVESTLPKLEQRLAGLQSIREELTERQEELLENQRLAERSRSQAMTEWGRKIEAFAHQIEMWTDQMRFYADQHEKNRRVLREVQELAHQVSQQQDQLKQVQRIAEDQIRHEVLELRTELERRLAQEIERRKHVEQQQVERDDKQLQRISELEELRKEDLVQVTAIADRVEALRRKHEEEVQHLQDVMYKVMQKRTEAAQLLLTDLKAMLGKEG